MGIPTPTIFLMLSTRYDVQALMPSTQTCDHIRFSIFPNIFSCSSWHHYSGVNELLKGLGNFWKVNERAL